MLFELSLETACDVYHSIETIDKYNLDYTDEVTFVIEPIRRAIRKYGKENIGFNIPDYGTKYPWR